jgi:hypothetical protein
METNLTAILAELKAEHKCIERAIKALHGIANSTGAPRKKFSAATRRKMAKAQRARWKAIKKSS